MGDFTTWIAYLADLKDNLANRDGMVAEHRDPDGTWVKYITGQELLDRINYVENKAASESATAGVATRRSYRKPLSGNGSW